MNKHEDWQKQVYQELDQAEAARAKGKEGMARVCARRAASIVVAEYLSRRGLPSPGPSVQDRIRALNSLPELSPQIKEVSEHFVMRVSPDYQLPIDVDLIAEARWLKEELFGNENNPPA